MNKPNKIEILISKLKKGELETLISILLRHGYNVAVWSDGTAVCIEYDFKDVEMAGCVNTWYDVEKQYIGDIIEDDEGNE